ncbi:citrate lyase subunit alpha [Fusibacter ferrireducens]|uniref:Citrate lyase alpha chain n=1 Tax=Fusibacter ferrireducens TaxID=2785058 RepID=A0ABR9ZZH1_9FIRM|nr:citrate lyase subunit alpha [Fusibacter ferrireducens]MBF4695295.1 citrate lyase subunit alpha [Fusibacter ferrireducens]
MRKHGKQIKIYDNKSKMVPSLEEAIRKSGLKSGMTISFHHHFREGDYTTNLVLKHIAALGIRDLTIIPSSLSKVHEPLIELIKAGVIKEIHTSGMRGKLAEFISEGHMEKPIIIRSHGGRARAIEAGEVKIDVAFLAVPRCDEMGNASGNGEHTTCGSLGYAMVDAEYADTVILVTDDLCEYPNMPASIKQQQVDYIVKIDEIGDPEGIASGATRYTKNPKELKIAEYASRVITALPEYKEGFSFQTGSGGASLAVTRYLREAMIKDGIKAGFALGGITQPMVDLLEEGYVKHLFDVQSFDLVAAASIAKNANHHEISASEYANPSNLGCVASKLDFVILSALEVDKAFNVNVMTGSDGVIMGASGGHCDTAQSAKNTIIVAPLYRGRLATVIEKVTTIITPGNTVDVLVTERGIAINPQRTDLIELLSKTNLPIVSIEALVKQAEQIVGKAAPISFEEQVVAIIEYRDGSVLDRIYKRG